MTDLFRDIIGSINDKRHNVIDADPEAEKAYNPYIVNMCYSYGPDVANTILFANEMNIRPFMDKKMQYDFYYYGLEKKKRFNKFLKPEAINNIDLILEYYQCSDKKAKEIIDVLTDAQIEIIKSRLYKGETINDKPKRKSAK